MERLTKHSKQTSHENGICCTHFRGPECLEVGGNCAMNCKWEEAAWSRLAAYEDTGLTPEEVERSKLEIEAGCVKAIARTYGIDINRLRKLAEADKGGRLVVLPCKVGDTVWVTKNPWTGKLLKKPLDAYVNGVKMYSHGIYVNLLFDTRKINGTRDYEINHIGKTVFLTREEAEAALEATKK
jgi:hypothetical protein